MEREKFMSFCYTTDCGTCQLILARPALTSLGRRGRRHANHDHQNSNRSATIERQKEGYEVFYKTEIMRVRQGLSPEELETLEAPLRAQFRQKYPGMKAGIDMYVYFEGNAVLQERYKIPTFEEWQAKNQASEGVVFDRSRRGV